MDDNYYYTTISRDEAPQGADFAVRLKYRDLEPYFMKGSIVYCSKTEPVRDGDVGIFLLDGKLVFRQYCEDMRGTMYFFSVNRALKKLDTQVSGGHVTCFGKVLGITVPLPSD